MAVCLENNERVRYFEIVKNWILFRFVTSLAVRKLIVLLGIWLFTQQYPTFLFFFLLLADTTLMVYS